LNEILTERDDATSYAKHDDAVIDVQFNAAGRTTEFIEIRAVGRKTSTCSPSDDF
jgi:hypothetical protein